MGVIFVIQIFIKSYIHLPVHRQFLIRLSNSDELGKMGKPCPKSRAISKCFMVSIFHNAR